MAQVLESGDVYFFYRPAVDSTEPGGLYDVSDIHLVLAPRDRAVYRLLTVGKKRLPETDDRFWGYVAFVTDDTSALARELGPQSYVTETLGERTRPAVRPTGEGVYALLRRGRHTEFAYVLELPEKPGEVHQALNIAAEGAFVLAVKNPRAASPPDVSLAERDAARFPAELQERFDGRRWLAVEPPDFLNHPGAEFLLVGLTADLDERDVELGADEETEDSADVFVQLRLDRDRHPVAPLLRGDWA